MFGILLDNSNKILGLQHAYMVLAGFTAIGLVASIIFYKINKQRSANKYK